MVNECHALRRKIVYFVVTVLCCMRFGGPVPVQAKVFLSKQEALALAFSEADRIENKSFVLTDAQVLEIESKAKARLETKLLTRYAGFKEGVLLGYAFIDTHVVRTFPEALLVVLTPQGVVRTLRMLAFYEPQDYLPSQRWLTQLEGKALSDDLRLQHGIHGIAGATLSSRAVTEAVRRVLAMHQVLSREER